MSGDEKQPQGTAAGLTQIVEVAKGMAVVAGSLGSLAVLFLWIGNAIVVARLRAYDLYGVVHYTDEYVTEAGYQFFQDVFTFFQDWRLLLLFAAVAGVTVATLPVGPFPGDRGATSGSSSVSRILGPVRWLRRRGLHYAVFLGLAVSVVALLTANRPVRRLYAAIVSQQRLLEKAERSLAGQLLAFRLREDRGARREFAQEVFWETLTAGEEPTLAWLEARLSEFLPGDAAPLPERLRRLQRDLGLPAEAFLPGPDFSRRFGASATYRALLGVRLSPRVQRLLSERVKESLGDLRHLLSANVSGEDDLSSFATLPANYEPVNASIGRLASLLRGVESIFEPADALTGQLVEGLSVVRPIYFGHFLLSYSFWVLMAVTVYLLLNIPRLYRFRLTEVAYFVFLLLTFLVVCVTLPTAYGRYNFEFRVQRLRDVVLSGGPGAADIRRTLDDLRAQGAALYILGPTQGREVIVGAAEGGERPPAILMIDRDVFKLMSLEPVRLEEIPNVIRLLKNSRL